MTIFGLKDSLSKIHGSAGELAGRALEHMALVLGEIGGPEAVSSLIDALCDDVQDVADHAIKSLVKLGNAATEPLVQNLRESTNAERRMWVIRALGEIGTEDAVGALMAVSLSSDEIWWLREEARDILQRLGYNNNSDQVH